MRQIQSVLSAILVLTVIFVLLSNGWNPSGMASACIMPNVPECDDPKLPYPSYDSSTGCVTGFKCVNSGLIQGGKPGVPCPVLDPPECADDEVLKFEYADIKMCVSEMLCIKQGCHEEAIIGPPCQSDEKKVLIYDNSTGCPTHWVCHSKVAINNTFVYKKDPDYVDPEDRITQRNIINISGDKLDWDEERHITPRLPEIVNLSRITVSNIINITASFEKRFDTSVPAGKQISLREKRRHKRLEQELGANQTNSTA